LKMAGATCGVPSFTATSRPAGMVASVIGDVAVFWTVTVKLRLARLPALSVAEQFTVVVAMGNVAPDAGLHVTGSVPSTMSVADGVKVTTAPLAPVACTVIFAGTVIDGGVVSCTVTVKLAVPLLPALSVAEHETVVVAMGNVAPDAGLQVTGSVPSTASVADAVKVTTAPLALVAETVIFAGTVRTGGVPTVGTETVSVSVTVMVSFTETATDVGGSDGAPVLAPAAPSATDCVKFDPVDVLVRLLRPALSVKVMVPVGVPEADSEKAIEKKQTAPGGRVVGKYDAPPVQKVCAMLNGDAGGDTARERFAWPRLETDNG
jgi:hypothetical protein